MSPSIVTVVCLFIFALSYSVDAVPQFGGFAQSNAQAGSFGGGGFGPPSPYGPGFPRPGFGQGYGQYQQYGPPNPYGRGFQRPGGLSVSVSKSVSIGRGGGAQSSANSGAVGK